MGMVCQLLGVTPAQASILQASPSLLIDLTNVAASDAQEDAFREHLSKLSPQERKVFEENAARLADDPDARELKQEIDAARTRLTPLGALEPALDLDKSWHILHYATTGSSGFDGGGNREGTLLDGVAIGGDLGGYGPARLITEASTSRFADRLRALDPARLRSRVDYRQMTRLHIYGVPAGSASASEYEEDMRDLDVGLYFPRLRDYVVAMATKGNALLVWIT